MILVAPLPAAAGASLFAITRCTVNRFASENLEYTTS